VLENCDKEFPYPNGGCRKVRVQGEDWYTFGDALVTADSNAPRQPMAGNFNTTSENLSRYITSQTGQFGPAIQFDTKGVEFGPWIRRFIAQVKRNWFIPDAAMNRQGHVVVTFNVHKDGSITDLTVLTPSLVESFNHAAYNTVLSSNPTQPLPPEYPADRAFFTVTFYYNETPPAQATPVSRSEPVDQLDARPATTVEDRTIEGLTQSDVRARFGHPNGVDVDPNGLTTWYYERPSQPTLKIYFVGGRASTKRPR
jgi:TonB family protein